MIRSFAFAWLLLSLFVGLCGGASAQTITATLEGRVTDASGAVVAGARVTAINTRTGLSRSAETSDAGEYRIPLLPAGEYTISVERTGFTKETKKVTLEIGQSGSADFALQAGGISEKVEVIGADAVAERTRSDVSSVINQRQIENLPVNGRQFIDFALLAPAVMIGDTTSGSTDVIIEPVTKLSFAGQNIHFNFVAIDGADNISTASGVQKTTPSQEAVQEFRVINSTYSAEFGRAVAGIVNIITKSGSNEFHGSLYDFFRDDALDARSILSSPGLDKLRQNQFGGTLGGPIKRDHTFFFTNYEGQRREESPFYNSTVLANIDLINLAKSRFGLPAEDLNVRRDSDYDNFLLKLDQNVGQRHTLLAHYFFNDGRLRNVSPLNDGFDLPSGFKDNFLRDQSIVGNLISTFSQTWVNELRAQYAHRSFDFPTVTSQPHLEVANTFAVGVNRGNPDFYKESRFELVDNAMFNRGNHSLSFGGNYNFVRTTESFPLFFPFEATFGSINDFVSGTPFVIFFQKFPPFTQPSFDTSVFAARRYPEVVRETAKGQLDHTYNALYVQDKWRASSRLSLSLGLRYEWETFPSEFLDNDLNNVDPRLGFAFNVGGKWNLVVRGGAGLFHGIIPTPLLMCQEPVCGGSGPFPGRENKEDQLNARTRAFAFASIPPRMQEALSDLFSKGLYPKPSTPFDFLAESVIVRFARDHQAPYGIQMSLGFEFEPVRGTAVSATYLRVKGVHLGSFFNVNQPEPSGKLLSGKDDFAALRFDRFNSVPGVRNPNFAVYFEADSRWNSVWDGLLLNVNRRMSRHLSYGISYTFSKGIDDGPNPSFVLIPENTKRIDLERALSADDARHRFVGNATIAGPTSGNILVRDFNFGLIVTLESPHHFTKFAGFDANGDVFGVNDRVALEARNTFTGDSYRSVDVRLSRSIRPTEKTKIELIAEAFNLFNTLNVRFFNTVYGDSIFNPPGTPGTFFEGARNPAYGSPRAIFNPRQLQFAFRFTF